MAEEGAEVDQIVAGKYRLARMVGRGGMGSVWEGVHISLHTRVAVKFIDAEHAQSKEAQSRFVNEARAAAKLRSKHVVQVFDQGVTDDGRPYIVMEFLAGEPLDRRLDRVGALSLAETAQVIGQVARALAKAHEAGIVHRDLKPENVFIIHDEEDGRDVVKVVDFGIAKFTDGSLGLSSATRTGSVLGTPYYMSPEQARGLRSVDHRADLWSIGVIAFRCIAGKLPFEGEAIGDLLVKICTAPLPVPSQLVPGIPPSFDAWFHRALAREPDQRFQSAYELAEGLAQVAGITHGMRPPMSSIDAAAAAGYPAAAATPWVGTPTPGHHPTPGTHPGYDTATGTKPSGSMTGAPITHNLAPSSSGKGILFAALGGAGLLAIVAVLVGIRLLAGGGSADAEAAAASAAAAQPPLTATEAPEVAPAVEPSAPEEPAVEDAAAAEPEEPEKPKVADKPAAANPAPAKPAPVKTTPSPPTRPKAKDPGDLLGY